MSVFLTLWTRWSDESIDLVLYEQPDDIPGCYFAATPRIQRHETATLES